MTDQARQGMIRPMAKKLNKPADKSGSQIQVVSKPMEAEISALELARLTSDLVAAGLIWKPESIHDSDQRRSIAAAFDFISTCRDVIKVKSMRLEWESQNKKIGASLERLKNKYGMDQLIPMPVIIKALQADRIKPTNDELKTADVNQPWEALSDYEKAGAIYMALTSDRLTRTNLIPMNDGRVHDAHSTHYFGSSDSRFTEAREGMQWRNLWFHFEALIAAKSHRQSRINRENRRGKLKPKKRDAGEKFISENDAKDTRGQYKNKRSR